MIDQFKIGQKVKVNSSSDNYQDWKDQICFVVGADCVKGQGHYDFEDVNYWIISEDDLKHGYGSTDGWKQNELTAA